jgi:hypothetical protein
LVVRVWMRQACLPVRRSIYVPLEAEEVALLAAMAKQERRSPHAQAAHLIAQALDRWRAVQVLEDSLDSEVLEEVA